MAPAVEPSSSSFQRSSSSPDLLSLPSFDFEQPVPHRQAHTGKDLPPLPAIEVPSFDTDFAVDTTVFANNQPPTPGKPSATVPAEQAHDRPAKRTLARSKTGSLIERPRSWFPNSKTTKYVAEQEPQRPTTSAGEDEASSWTTKLPDRGPLERGLTVSDSFANFAKRSWISASRSPSPKGRSNSPTGKKPRREGTEDKAPSKITKANKQPTLAAAQPDQNLSPDLLKPTPPKALTRASGYLAKMKHKQPISFAKFNNNGAESDNSCASSATSLAPPSNSIETQTSHPTSLDSNTNTNTDDSSSEMPPRSRDVLWSSFKTLETDLKGFFSKQTGQRIAQLQAAVLPFLRGTTNHPSTKSLRPEDIDRRAVILNKWWIAILDMLEGQPQQQPVAGVDRPALLEAATLLMMRSEWRQLTPCFQPLADRSPADLARRKSWTSSSASTDNSAQAAFLAESAEHNVRTMFVSNLVRQMGVVVDKLSLRHAPLSLVNFGGKTCAYAFFFAPSVADVLVRLWALDPDLLRRSSDGLGLPRRNKPESNDVAAPFPSNLSAFAWTSPKGMWDMIKQSHQMPLSVARIPWTGPWVMRWKGRDTDLFFIFCKYFFVLSNQFMLPGLPLKEKAKSPAFAVVQAQLLGILDTTIHRQTAAVNAYGQPPLLDSMHGSDASALALPLPPSNPSKGMSENRLVVLLKDFLSDDSTGFAGAKHTFAEAFSSLMKAATRKTSQFDSAACFALCDFTEEVLAIYSEFETPGGSAAYIDWEFWIDVWKKILGSLNTMSEIRVLSFIFGCWDLLVKDPRRKEMLCLDWLLKEDVFGTFFNHWCPMVRAYYHRLLCWRICRDEGSASELDETIFRVAATRLKLVWAHYLHLKQTAEDAGRLPPSTAPVLPTPGKKFMIIRQEVNVPQTGLFMGFDSFAKIPSDDPLAAQVVTDSEVPPKSDSKKRWSLLGKVLSFTGAVSAQAEPTNGHKRSSSWDDDLQNARRETAEARGPRPGAPGTPPKFSTPDGGDAESGSSSPVYEEPKHVFRFFLGWQQSQNPPRERVLTRPRLPAPAQSLANVRPLAGVSPPAGVVGEVSSTGDQLIHGAKNATAVLNGPASNPEEDSPGVPAAEPLANDEDDELQERLVEPITQPVKPTGLHAKNTVYVGRALAEWGQIIFEYNAFVDRRHEEGVRTLSEVEVPLLGVEGFRKLGG